MWGKGDRPDLTTMTYMYVCIIGSGSVYLCVHKYAKTSNFTFVHDDSDIYIDI